jgi:hypothetical protein
MDRCSLVAGNGSKPSSPRLFGSLPPRPLVQTAHPWFVCWRSMLSCLVVLAIVLAPWPGVAAMRSARVKELRRETVDLFYHGFDNYMRVAFPEDEVCLSNLSE